MVALCFVGIAMSASNTSPTDQSTTPSGAPQPRGNVIPGQDRVHSTIAFSLGTALICLSVFIYWMQVPFPYTKWLFVVGAALLGVGAGSEAFVRMNIPAAGQAITAGGLLAGIVMLGWLIPDPTPSHAFGVIHTPQGTRVVLETSKAKIYSRPSNMGTTSFLLFQDEASIIPSFFLV